MPRNEDPPLLQQGDGPVPLGGQPTPPVDASEMQGEDADALFRSKAQEALSHLDSIFRSLPKVYANAYCANVKSALAFSRNHLADALKGA